MVPAAMKSHLLIATLFAALCTVGASSLVAAAAPRTIEITANDQMKYSVAMYAAVMAATSATRYTSHRLRTGAFPLIVPLPE